MEILKMISAVECIRESLLCEPDDDGSVEICGFGLPGEPFSRNDRQLANPVNGLEETENFKVLGDR